MDPLPPSPLWLGDLGVQRGEASWGSTSKGSEFKKDAKERVPDLFDNQLLLYCTLVSDCVGIHFFQAAVALR